MIMYIISDLGYIFIELINMLRIGKCARVKCLQKKEIDHE